MWLWLASHFGAVFRATKQPKKIGGPNQKSFSYFSFEARKSFWCTPFPLFFPYI